MVRNIYARFDEFLTNTRAKDLTAAETRRRFAHLTSACQWAEEYCGRSFAAVMATKSFDGDGSRLLILPDLISITEITEGDTTLTSGTDYRLLPTNETPKMRIERLNGCWPVGFENVEIEGLWGYSYTVEDTLETVPTGGMTDSVTTLTFEVAPDIALGETLVIGSEQVYVAAINDDGDELTLERGVNGTTAAAHLEDVTINRRAYPLELGEAVMMQASRLARAVQTGGNNAGGNTFAAGFPSEYPMIRDMLAPLRRVVIR